MFTGCQNLRRMLFPLINTRICSTNSFISQTFLCRFKSIFSFSPSHPSHLHSFLRSPLSSTLCCPHSALHTGQMKLKDILEVMEQLAPLSLAESWDNVGLLVEPSTSEPIKTILLTNDLTDPVMAEAEAMSCDLIISYHPPLFCPIKSLVQRDWKQKLLIRAVEGRMGIFSPHTSWDSVKGGLNDWLIGGLGSGQVSVLSQAFSGPSHRYKMEFTVRDLAELDVLKDEMRECDRETALTYSSSSRDDNRIHVSWTCSESTLAPNVQTLLQQNIASQSLSILQLHKNPLPGHGQGRLSILDQPITIATAIQKLKSHLGLSHLRLALGLGKTLESLVCTVAVCAGSGASVLKGVEADLYLTGEMSHHDVLDVVEKGISIILSDHSQSERGFLTVFRERLVERLSDSVTVVVSKMDRGPLEVV